jgi:hypothetical protein
MRIVFRSLLILSILLTSCKKEKEYEFKIINNTGYRIDKIEFSCSIDHLESVVPHGTSPTFILKYKKKAAALFSEPLICFTILNYSDSTNVFENTLGKTASIDNLNKKGLNSVEINLSAKPDSINIFDIVLKTH